MPFLCLSRSLSSFLNAGLCQVIVLQQSGDKYFGQTGHGAQCMVFANNAVESGANNFVAFLELAKRSGSTSASGTTLSIYSRADPALHCRHCWLRGYNGVLCFFFCGW